MICNVPANITIVLVNFKCNSKHYIQLLTRGEVLAHKTSLPPSTHFFFIEVPVLTKPGKSAVMYLCVRGIDFASFYVFDI